MGCAESSAEAPQVRVTARPAAGTNSANPPQRPQRAQAQVVQQRGQAQATAQSRQQDTNQTLKTAPLVKSLVALQRDQCTVEKNDAGYFLRCVWMASCPGEAIVFFLAKDSSDTGQKLEPLQAKQVSREAFQAGLALEARLFLCADLPEELKAFPEGQGQHHLVLELRADNDDVTAVSVQRSFLKFSEDNTLHVQRQQVQVGDMVRTLDPLFGTLPNKQAVAGASPACLDPEGGDCVICLSNPREVAILHCRHVCLCLSCAKITSSTWSFQCPVCRGRVAAMVGCQRGQ